MCVCSSWCCCVRTDVCFRLICIVLIEAVCKSLLHEFQLLLCSYECVLSIDNSVTHTLSTNHSTPATCSLYDTVASGELKAGDLVKVDGPYGAASEDIFGYKFALFVGAGWEPHSAPTRAC